VDIAEIFEKMRKSAFYYFAAGLFYGMGFPLLLLGAAVKSSIVILMGFGSVVLGFVMSVNANNLVKSLSKEVKNVQEVGKHGKNKQK